MQTIKSAYVAVVLLVPLAALSDAPNNVKGWNGAVWG